MQRARAMRAFAGLMVFSVASLFALPGLRATEASARRDIPARRVHAAEVGLGPDVRRYRVHGVAQAQEQADLAFTVAGRLSARVVQVGDRVQAGALLARLDARGYDHGARAAEAGARQAQAQWQQHVRDRERIVALGEAKAVSREQLDRISSAVEAAEASRDAAEVQRDEAARTLRETELRAPFGGTVVAVHRSRGEFAAPGVPVVTLSGRAGLEVEVEIPGRVASGLAVGHRVRLRFPLDADGETDGVITSVSESALGPGHMFPVVVAFDGGDSHVRPGSAVEATFSIPIRSALTVPVSAVLAPSGREPFVFRIREARAERVAVTLGRLFSERIEVEGGLAAGDRVVVAGYSGLVSGERVEVAP